VYLCHDEIRSMILYILNTRTYFFSHPDTVNNSGNNAQKNNADKTRTITDFTTTNG